MLIIKKFLRLLFCSKVNIDKCRNFIQNFKICELLIPLQICQLFKVKQVLSDEIFDSVTCAILHFTEQIIL